jgi:hypothetical protein
MLAYIVDADKVRPGDEYSLTIVPAIDPPVLAPSGRLVTAMILVRGVTGAVGDTMGLTNSISYVIQIWPRTNPGVEGNPTDMICRDPISLNRSSLVALGSVIAVSRT